MKLDTEYRAVAVTDRPSRLLYYTILIALTVVAADQIAGVVELWKNKGEIARLLVSQATSLEQAGRVEQQLDSLATGVAHLAATGNKHAQGIVSQMQAQGVAIKAPSGSLQQKD